MRKKILALLLGLCVVTGIAVLRYDAPEAATGEKFWTRENVSAFMSIPVCEGEVIQKFTAGGKQLTEFVLFFENYAADDSGNIVVKLEDSKQKEYYCWDVPVSALTGELFCLGANVEQELKKGREYSIRVYLKDGESDIAVRALSKEEYPTGIHPSVGVLTVDGAAQEAVLYLQQSYQRSVSYPMLWVTALVITLLALLVFLRRTAHAAAVIWETISTAILLAVGYCSIELLSGNIYTAGIEYAMITCMLFLAFYLVIKAIAGRLAFYAVALLTLAAGITNYYVLQFKGVEFLITDIQAFSTAMSVVGNYEFTFPPVVFTVVLLYACLLLLRVAVDVQYASAYRRAGLIKRAGLLAAGLIAVMAVNMHTNGATLDYFTISKNFQKYGWWYTNTCVLKNLSMEKPKDYSEQEVERILTEIGQPEEQEIRARNLIVIMNEALDDLSMIGELETNQDYMPFIHSLRENTVKGNLHTSTFGGGTCITEYEFLTGNAFHFMPMGAMPYSVAMSGEEPGMARTLKDQGYYTVAMHPYDPTNWNRDHVYEAMGFDEFISEDDFQGGERIRNYITDKANYDKIIQCYEEFQGEDLFIFNVTMQNHGGYDAANGQLETSVTVDNMESKEAETYLSLVRESDKAFEYLLSYFSQVSEPTMIVMFGDHLPALPDSFYNDLYGKEPDERTLAEKSLRYVTPYVIWTNYASSFAEAGDTSVNYLGRLVLQYAGVQLPQYDRFILQQREEIPVIGTLGIREQNGSYIAYADIPDALLQDYKILQYMRQEDRASKYYDIFKIDQ